MLLGAGAGRDALAATPPTQLAARSTQPPLGSAQPQPCLVSCCSHCASHGGQCFSLSCFTGPLNHRNQEKKPSVVPRNSHYYAHIYTLHRSHQGSFPLVGGKPYPGPGRTIQWHPSGANRSQQDNSLSCLTSTWSNPRTSPAAPKAIFLA